MQITAAVRVFLLNSLRLPDPDPEMSPDQVRQHYAHSYPALALATVSEPRITSGDEVEFSFDRPTGQVKG